MAQQRARAEAQSGVFDHCEETENEQQKTREEEADEEQEEALHQRRFSETMVSHNSLHCDDTVESPTDFSALAENFRQLVAVDYSREHEMNAAIDAGSESDGEVYRCDTSNTTEEKMAVEDAEAATVVGQVTGEERQKHQQQQLQQHEVQDQPQRQEEWGGKEEVFSPNKQTPQPLEPEPEREPHSEQLNNEGDAHTQVEAIRVGHRCEITLHGRRTSAEVCFLGRAPLLGSGAFCLHKTALSS